jgi:hypothetical protein
MNSWRMTTKIFAVFSLIFLNFTLASAQTESDSSIYELPAGTIIHVQMDNGINSKVSSVNDTFTATIVEPIIVREIVVVPTGATIEGKVVKVKRAAIGNKSGSLVVSFETLKFRTGEKREISGVLVKNLEVSSNQRVSALAIIGGTALGGILGAASKANNGALIGAGIGAGAGTGIAFLRKGKEVEIVTDEKFEIKLTKKVTLPVRDF